MPWQDSNLRPSGTEVQRPDALPTELHGRPYIIYVERSHCKLLEATPARNPAALLGLHNRLLVLLNIRIPAAHSAFVISHPSLGLTLLPILVSCDLSRRSRRIRNLPCRFRLYLRVEYRPFPLRRLVGLFRCRFDQCNVQACALAACTASVISINAFAYLPGLPLRVPRRLWEGGGVEPPAHRSYSGNHRRFGRMP